MSKSMNFINSNKLFSVLYFIIVIITISIIYKLGFHEASIQSASQLERLRNITFPIWDQHTFSEHGFLVFLSIENFEKKIAYSNHSIAYLFYMYILYKIELLTPLLPMRVTAAFLNIISFAGVTFYFMTRQIAEKLNFDRQLLILISIIFMVSMPGFWISSSRFNVDNPFPLMFVFHAFTSFLIWKNNKFSVTTIMAIIIYAIFSPISAALLGLSLLIWACRKDGLDWHISRLAFLGILAGIAFYIPAPTISKLLGFTSSNSSWLFRAGLDGDTTYFNNIIQVIDILLSTSIAKNFFYTILKKWQI